MKRSDWYHLLSAEAKGLQGMKLTSRHFIWEMFLLLLVLWGCCTVHLLVLHAAEPRWHSNLGVLPQNKLLHGLSCIRSGGAAWDQHLTRRHLKVTFRQVEEEPFPWLLWKHFPRLPLRYVLSFSFLDRKGIKQASFWLESRLVHVWRHPDARNGVEPSSGILPRLPVNTNIFCRKFSITHTGKASPSASVSFQHLNWLEDLSSRGPSHWERRH